MVPVAGDESLELARRLAREQGILVGTTSGATLAAALQIARRSPPGTNIVCMLPDTGERYMSTPLFEHIGEEMNAEEVALSQSTPGYRFDIQPACPIPVRIDPAATLDAEAERFVSDVINEEPVVLFALEWCEFCWSVRKLFGHLGIEYRSIDLDSVEYQQDDLGGKIRAVLAARTGTVTIPQIFVAGEHIGGCTEMFDAMRDGSLPKTFRANGIRYDDSRQIDPYSLFPKWLQPRKSA